jgi:hypothetical protein
LHMTDNLPARQPIERSKQIRGRLKHAIELMIWSGLDRDQAAQQAGMQPHSLYCAFRKTHVRGHYLAELAQLRTSERAKNVHALVGVRDNSANDMARVAAAKALDVLSDETNARAGSVQLPGMVIVIEAPKAARAPELKDVTPPPRTMIEHNQPPLDNPDFIPIETITGESSPTRDDPPPLVEEPALLREPRAETLDEVRERLLAGVPRLAPPGLAACPPQPWESHYKPPQPRGGPRASRFRSRRGE